MTGRKKPKGRRLLRRALLGGSVRANSLIPPLCKGGGGIKGFIVFVVDRCTDFFFLTVSGVS